MEFIVALVGIWIVTALLYFLIDYIVVALFIIWCLSLSKVFQKFNEEEYKSYIPFYNIYIVLKAANLNKYLMLVCLTPLLGKIGFITFYLFIIYISVYLAKQFKKDKKFLTNIMIAPPLYMIELGKDNSFYTGTYNKE